MNVLGLCAYHGDASAALLVDGQLVAAVEEERFRRTKHWSGFPRESIKSCLSQAGLAPDDIDVFAVGRDPGRHLLRRGWFALRHRPSAKLVGERLRNRHKVRELPQRLAQELGLDASRVRRRFQWVEHHPAHLASAFYASPFEEAAVASIDGFGDFVSTAFAHGKGTRLDVLDRVYFPHSLGLVYLAVTQFLGFPKYGDEFKVMGLAPYGKPTHLDAMRSLVRLRPDGKFELDLRYFRHWSEGASMTWDDVEPHVDNVYTSKLEELLGPARDPASPLEPRHEDIARSLQALYEEVAFHVLNGLHERVGSTRLCLAGGCGMNSVANGMIRSRTPFREVFIQPAAGDNGTSLGAALYVLHHRGGAARGGAMEHGFWGPQFESEAIAATLKDHSTEVQRARCRVWEAKSEKELVDWTARRIADSKIVGWFQGRMEWGARALGNRSILADPRRIDMREIINSKIKFREKFRPFAPAVAVEALDDYFVDAVPDPFMVQVYPVRPEKRTVIPAVTHVDGSGRLQTVSPATNPRFHALLQAFGKLTGVPVLLNTSFNENEPIVNTPEQALDCFLRTRMDVLVMGLHVVEKE